MLFFENRGGILKRFAVTISVRTGKTSEMRSSPTKEEIRVEKYFTS